MIKVQDMACGGYYIEDDQRCEPPVIVYRNWLHGMRWFVSYSTARYHPATVDDYGNLVVVPRTPGYTLIHQLRQEA